MFTIEQIKAAHSKVRSGADFPNYIKDLSKLGVTSYETFVADGHTEYFGKNNFKITSDAEYHILTLAETSDANLFEIKLKAHQQGKTDYQTFCSDCANSGIKKWAVLISEMTCTYYDSEGKTILNEPIPEA